MPKKITGAITKVVMGITTFFLYPYRFNKTFAKTLLCVIIFILMILGISIVWVRGQQKRKITFLNYSDATVIRYPVLLLRGTLTNKKINSVTIINTTIFNNTTSKRHTRELQGLAYKGRFKVMTELVSGKNRLIVRAGESERSLTVNYRPQTNPYLVRVFYMTDNTGNTEYQTPFENDTQDYRGKLDTAVKLMQTFTAEQMNDLGYGRGTFNPELDEAGRVKVRILKGEHSAEHYYKMTGHQLYNYIYGLIDHRLPNPKAKNLVITAFTRFDPNQDKAMAHTALGGGSLALFGGGNLFAWPTNLAEVPKTFMDDRLIDNKKYFSDSAGRHTVWAIASTTLGAALHEMGHTFGLPHSKHPHDIMTRGMDRFNRVFTCLEPSHARRKTSYEFPEDSIACWAPASAAWLRFNRWFALDEKVFVETNRPGILIERDTQKILIESDHGIGSVILTDAAGDACLPFFTGGETAAPKKIEIPLDEFGEDINGEKTTVRVIDIQGLSTSATLSQL